MRWPLAAIAAFAIVAAACDAIAPRAVATPSPSPTASARATVVPATLVPAFDAAKAKAHLDFLAHPARGGRFTGSAGYEAAARYVADELRAAGVEPFGDGGTFFQRFRMPLVDLAATPVLERTSGTPKSYRHRVDFTESVGGGAGGGAAEGRLVFVGEGLAADYVGIDARDAIVLVLGARSDPTDTAVREGARAILRVSDRMIKFSYIPRFNPRTLPTLVVSTAATDELLAGSGKRVADLARSVDEQRRAASPAPGGVSFETDVRLRASVPLTPVRDVETMNVVGIVRGADPDGAKRAVLVGGHLDGIGTDPSGAVFQGANDNASGPAITIEIARAVVAKRAELRHSVIFIAFAAEEQGLHGSEHYANQTATIPGRSESLIAFLNLDVVGCCGGELAASEETPTLHARLRSAAQAEGVPFSTTRGSSDHASFARRRVDVAHLIWSDIGPIHTLRDTADLVDAAHLGTAGRVALRVVLELARGAS